MAYKGWARSLVLLQSMLIVYAVTAHGFDVSVSTNGVEAKESFILDGSTTLNMISVLSGGSLKQEHNIFGSGNNAHQWQVDGQGYSLANSLVSSGSLVSSASTTASTGSAAVNQDTKMSGHFGYISSQASSDENSRYIVANFDGDGGDLDASLACAADHAADIRGGVSVAGINGLDSGVDGKDIAVAIEGLYPASDGTVGGFEITSGNLQGSHPPSQDIAEGTVFGQANDSNSYALGTWRWLDNPGLRFYLINDADFQNTGLNLDDTRTAMINAANTWDAATTQRLFGGYVVPTTKLSKNTIDGCNAIGWSSLDSNALAYSRTVYACNWMVTGADGNSYKRALDSDICFNTKYSWTTIECVNSNNQAAIAFDVQTVALHEMGHTYGMEDLYTLPGSDPRRNDFAQVMNAYDGKQRKLGAGDIKGIQMLYGK